MKNDTILLVEDNPDDVELTLDAFKRSNLGNPVVVARDGAEALSYLAGDGAGEPPAVMILDLNLPKVPGLEVLRRVRADERWRALPTVVLTTSMEERDIAESYRLGVNAFVRKPVAFEEFVQAAAQLGWFWLKLNVRPPAARA